MPSVLNSLLYILYWPLCRAYGRYFVGDNPADRLYTTLCGLQFFKVHRYWPNLKHPQTFNEQLWARMLYDRDPLLTLISDKLRVREYVSNKLGSDVLIPLLWSGSNPEDIPFNELPLKFVIKTNHGCGYVIIVSDRSNLDQRMVKRQLRKWLATNFAEDTFLGIAWAYKHITPTIIIEQFVGINTTAPVDYKFYCFSNTVEFVTVHYDRFKQHKTRSFDRSFHPYDFRYDFDQWEGECHCPANFGHMVKIAEILSEGFDFIRVDLYSVNNKVYFSELTPYPGGVSTQFLPLSRDYILGQIWHHNT